MFRCIANNSDEQTKLNHELTRPVCVIKYWERCAAGATNRIGMRCNRSPPADSSNHTLHVSVIWRQLRVITSLPLITNVNDTAVILLNTVWSPLHAGRIPQFILFRNRKAQPETPPSQFEILDVELQ